MSSKSYFYLFHSLSFLTLALGAASTYQPPAAVKTVNSFPSYSYVANASTSVTSMEYVMNAVGFPVALFVISILALIIFIFVLLTRICCKCCKCIPDVVTRRDEERRKKVKRNKYCCSFLFFLVVLLTAAADLSSYLGYAKVQLAVDTATDGMLGLRDTMVNLSSQMEEAISISTDYFTFLDTTCPQAQIDYQGIVNKNDDYLKYVNTLKSAFTKGYKGIDDYGGYIYFFPMGIALLLAICVLYIIGFIFPCSYVLKFDMFLSILVYLLVAILCFVVTILLVFLSGFCMDPDSMVIDLAPAGNVRNSTEYFLLCLGNKPKFAQPPTDILNRITADWGANCASSVTPAQQENFIVHKNATALALEQFYDGVSCEAISPGWDATVHQALCTDFFTGLYNIWLSLYVSIFFLFVTMIVCSLMYQYYRKEVREFLNNDVRVVPGGDIELQPYNKQ